MWKDNKYTIRRNPTKKGLYFASKPSDFQPHIEQKLSRKYTELISVDEQHPGICFLPLENNIFSFAMCRKERTKEENRIHDTINAFIAKSSEEALDICENYIAQTNPLDLFFSEEANIPEFINSDSENTFKNIITFMLNEHLLLQCCKKLITLKNNNLKMILSIPTADKYLGFCLLTYIAILSNTELFITADAICLPTYPDIIISDDNNLKSLNGFINSVHYEKTSFEEFLNNDHIIENAKKSQTKCLNKINSVLNNCTNYLFSNNEISEHKLYSIIDNFYKEDNNYYGIFKSCLKDLLCNVDYNTSTLNKFITLTYIVFKVDTYSPFMGFSSTMTSAPYDFNGMCNFLKSKSTSTRQYYQFLKAMLTIQFKTCFKTPSEKLAFRDALNDVITDFVE